MENSFRRSVTYGAGSLYLYTALQEIVGYWKDICHSLPKEVLDFCRNRKKPEFSLSTAARGIMQCIKHSVATRNRVKPFGIKQPELIILVNPRAKRDSTN